MAEPKRRGSDHVDSRSETALVIIDMITDFDFEDGDALFQNTQPIVDAIAKLRSGAKKAGVPTIFLNDNFGRWQEDFRAFRDNLMRGSEKARGVIERLAPGDEDYFVLKPQRSGFYATTLEVLLEWMQVKNLIITGITTDICVLFTAHDAYMRGFHVHTPSDCTAAVRPEYYQQALTLLERVADARTDVSTGLEISR